jgi:Protein of unknown function (DUF1759)
VACQVCSRLDVMGQPSLEELLRLLDEQQVREMSLKEKYEQVVIELEALKMHAAEIPKKTKDDQKLSVEENSSSGCHKVKTEWSDVAMLMKQAYVEDLPDFAGNFREWARFVTVFHRTTKAASFDDVANVGRLDKALKGEARELVLDQLTFGFNPKVILTTLEKRYGKPELILRSLSLELIEFPEIHSLNDPNFFKFVVAVKTYVAQLRAVNLGEELHSNLMASFLHVKLSQLPSIYQRWVVKDKSSTEAIVETFANFIMAQWESLPTALTSHDCVTSSENDDGQKRSLNIHSSSQLKPARWCFKCGGNHDTSFCYSFRALGVLKRWKLVRRRGICFCCLKSTSHRARDCPTNQHCSEPGCEAKHHRLLHFNFTEKLVSNVSANQSKTSIGADESWRSVQSTRESTASDPKNAVVRSQLSHKLLTSRSTRRHHRDLHRQGGEGNWRSAALSTHRKPFDDRKRFVYGATLASSTGESLLPSRFIERTR